MGSQHPSPNVKNPLRIRAANWLEIITSRDAKSACFQGSQTSCTEIVSGFCLPKFRRKRSHGCILLERFECGISRVLSCAPLCEQSVGAQMFANFNFLEIISAGWLRNRTGTVGTGTIGTVFPETESGTGTAGTVFQEPKPELEPSFPVKLY